MPGIAGWMDGWLMAGKIPISEAEMGCELKRSQRGTNG